jgi:hypothetical protein
MMMYDLCERCGNEIAWDPDYADYTTGRVVTVSLEQEHGVFVKSKCQMEAWCDTCKNTHATHNKQTGEYEAA